MKKGDLITIGLISFSLGAMISAYVKLSKLKKQNKKDIYLYRTHTVIKPSIYFFQKENEE
jgi:hypothetical protein